MFKNHRCSLQYHNQKKETIYVLSGQLKIISGTTIDSLIEKNLHRRRVYYNTAWNNT